MESWGSFTFEVEANGVAWVVFNRPPVNAVSVSVYEDLASLAERVDTDPNIKVLVLAAHDYSRTWCGGADLNDFLGMNPDRRKERYEFINDALPRFARISRPAIAAINGPIVGVGMLLAGLCDMRVASEAAHFSCPEIDYGLLAGGGCILALAKMSEAKVREMLFTGARFSARELEPTGYFNYIVPQQEVLPRAIEMASRISAKSLTEIIARKQGSLAVEGKTWIEGYLVAQALSGQPSEGTEGTEGVTAFLEKRWPAI